MKRLVLIFPLSLFAIAAFASTVSAQAIRLTWLDNSDNESAFTVERSEDGVTFAEVAVLPADTITYTDAALEIGATYYYRVRAVNEHGYSGYTNIASGEARGAPSDPSAIGIEPAAATLRITVREDGTISIEPIAK
jgi:fibronectin type 3 domain-containing protein